MRKILEFGSSANDGLNTLHQVYSQNVERFRQTVNLQLTK